MSQPSELEKKNEISICVLTVSDTRNKETDKSGGTIIQTAEGAGHHIADYRICTDEPTEISRNVEEWLRNEAVEAIIITGGSGIGFRDVTIETVTPYFTKTIDGFGELFRFLSYTEDVGSKALLSRATAGTIDEKALFALPGSSKAVKLAMEKLILPELHHIVHELTKHRKG
ncbi:MogA/MoaB family molybdenum cofactor biosynthesis protein [Sporosarcina thermotolerans]|uniref:Molybdenum cofactor biosynthesis protein B n=1 Tax=Sporosarcina thermotolerans TaxID=633404 RepID=A0AAW9AC53_9BACL|nr:MogA/MoaB family molybdenum cofactor biosynthesis protein [Sporosarcina thermotolerans]MDW0118777.1 MogA/MoaB family molybdenum cofactor biosynthesis protein [Sporosarcina thermotolerans]WHT48446.1 MogA/MoaB family molybdenum cofactor biosynthesis protein [Sporosarcina thermotolerans]